MIVDRAGVCHKYLAKVVEIQCSAVVAMIDFNNLGTWHVNIGAQKLPCTACVIRNKKKCKQAVLGCT